MGEQLLNHTKECWVQLCQHLTMLMLLGCLFERGESCTLYISFDQITTSYTYGTVFLYAMPRMVHWQYTWSVISIQHQVERVYRLKSCGNTAVSSTFIQQEGEVCCWHWHHCMLLRHRLNKDNIATIATVTTQDAPSYRAS
jgi:hypothetical protein